MEGWRILRIFYSFPRKCDGFSLLGQTIRNLHKGINLDNLIQDRMREQLLAKEGKTNVLKSGVESDKTNAPIKDATSDIAMPSQETAKKQETPEKSTVVTAESTPNRSGANVCVSGLIVKKSTSPAGDVSKLNSSVSSRIPPTKPLRKSMTPTEPVCKSAGETSDETARIGRLIEKNYLRYQTQRKPQTATEKSKAGPTKKQNHELAKPKTATKRATTSSVQGADTPKTLATSNAPKEEKPMDAQKDKVKTHYKVQVQTFISNKPTLRLRGTCLVNRNDRSNKEQNPKYTNTNGMTFEKPAKK